jgi:3-hydroxyisobutyrate dehydrogenase-like beta-hydroxyacid dehydrogenase
VENTRESTPGGVAVGFIGLGIMGAPMAGRLLAAGHRVTVYNRTGSRAEPLVAAGARQARSPREAAAGAEVVISIVTDSPDAEAVLLGPEGAAAGAAPDTLVVDMSTIAPDTARAIGRRLGERGLRFLDAPVTGGDVGAREGTLSILVGGAAADLERARPLFAALGKRVTHCGPVGAGQTVKACNQILCALNMVGVTEALHLAQASGIDQRVMLEALGPGAGGSWALDKLGPRIAAGDFAPGFMVRLIQKDLRIVDGMARAAGLPLEGAALAARNFADNEAHGEGELGTQAMYRVVARRVGRREPG